MARTNGRTSEILEAVCRVVARKGAHGLRMADVAREASVSNALLHYYFETRAELLGRAFAFAEERARAHTEAELAALPSDRERLRRFLLLYVEDETVFHESWVLWNEVWSSGLFDDELRPLIEDSYGRWVARIVDLVRAVAEEEAAQAEVDAEASGRRLAALADGLGSQVVIGLLNRSEATKLVEGALELELGRAGTVRSRRPRARA
jgi:AcrR family transcriptional regulator